MEGVTRKEAGVCPALAAPNSHLRPKSTEIFAHSRALAAFEVLAQRLHKPGVPSSVPCSIHPNRSEDIANYSARHKRQSLASYVLRQISTSTSPTTMRQARRTSSRFQGAVEAWNTRGTQSEGHPRYYATRMPHASMLPQDARKGWNHRGGWAKLAGKRGPRQQSRDGAEFFSA